MNNEDSSLLWKLALYETYIGIDRGQKVGGYMFRKYIREQLLVVGLEMLHLFLLLGRLQLPQEV